MDIYLEDKALQILKLGMRKQYCSLEDMAEKIGVSTRTVRNYMKQINKELEGIAIFKNERGKGYRLFVEVQEKLDLALNQMNQQLESIDAPQKRLAFIIKSLIMDDDRITLDDLAFSMNIGRTTLVNDLKKAEVVLGSYNLKIIGKQNSGVYLSGEELNIRLFILENVFNYLYVDYPLDKEVEIEVMEIVRKHGMETDTHRMLWNFIIVMLDRLLTEKPLQELHSKFEKLVNTKEFDIALEIAQTLEKVLSIRIPEKEVLFITLPIAGRRTPTNAKVMAEIFISDDIKHLLDLIIKELDYKMNLTLDGSTMLKDLAYHLTFLVNRLIFNIRLKNPMLEDIKEKFPVAFRMAQIAGRVVEEKYNVVISEHELGYLAVYFCVYISEKDAKLKTLKSVAVICGTGRGTSRLVASQLQSIIGSEVAIDLFSEDDITKGILSKYDIIFCTIKIPFELDQPVIRINEIFDTTQVAKEVEKVTYLKKYPKKIEVHNDSMINAFMDQDRFFLLDSNKSYKENVCQMVDSLQNKGYVDRGFKERILEREEKGSTVFDRHIGLPHTINYASEHLMLAMGVYGDISGKEETELNLIILLGIPQHIKDDASLLVKIYDEIISIASNPLLLKKIAQSTSCHEISKLLKTKHLI